MPDTSNGAAPTPRKITLYSYAMSPYAAKVHAFLLYKDVPFDIQYINPLKAKKELPIGHQVPAIEIDGVPLNDSTPIGLWLDEMCPENPLLPPEGPEREKLLAVDQWISDVLIPGTFRHYPGRGINGIRNGWKLSHVMYHTAHSKLPLILKWLWPFIVINVPFVNRLIAQSRQDGLPDPESKLALYDQFIAHLEGGPFVAGRESPSMPDFSAYPQFAVMWATGFIGSDAILQRPELMAWLKRMKPYIDKAPQITPDHVRVRDWPE